ncbi:MAG: RluA family pseudouridine synthase [Alphaproteobacteria bacterium]|nr:RluA family pseudouridine synthase [Alphaproteobacteria bacterium]
MSGVHHRSVSADEADIRLDRWFKRHFPALTHGQLEKMLRKGQVRVDGGRAKANFRLVPGQEIRVPPMPDSFKDNPRPGRTMEPNADLVRQLRDSVLYKDDDVLAINKPAGIAVQGGSGITVHIDGALDEMKFEAKDRPRLVHRLDKDTAGVLLLGRSAKAAAELTKAFRHQETEKLYWAVVIGCPEVPDGQIEAAVAKSGGPDDERMHVDVEHGKSAITDFKVIASAAKKVSWLDLRPRTGRTHQLRVHCAAIDAPILGDGKYGGRTAFLADLPGAKALHLFARGIKIPRASGPPLAVSAPLPPQMAETFKYFGFEESEADDL